MQTIESISKLCIFIVVIGCLIEMCKGDVRRQEQWDTFVISLAESNISNSEYCDTIRKFSIKNEMLDIYEKEKKYLIHCK